MKIVSLLASATEIVAVLGLEDRLVGISHECDYPPHVLDRPRVSRPRFDPAGLDSAAIDAAVKGAMASYGSVYALDTELLRRLQPDLILTQAVCDVCAVPTSLAEEAARALGRPITVLSLDAHGISGIMDSIRQVAAATGVESRGEEVVARLGERMEQVRRAVKGAVRPRVLALEWMDPPYVPGHWVPEMIELAGGKCLAGEPGRRSREVSWDRLADMDPDVVVVMPCGYGLEDARGAANRYADRLTGIAPRAVAAGQCFVVDGSSYFNRSGPRVAEGVEILGALFHPDRVRGVTLDGRAERWSPSLTLAEGS
ncbi:Vitamin B12-binding protein [bacterium HR33]|nr:Vitamin B12-binding protein [bacterium HR33]